MKLRKAIIPAAGLGTRFLPATKAQPKEMLPIVDKPTIQYIVEEAIASGVEEILIITGRNKRAIEDHFDKSVELELELEQKCQYDLLDLTRKISNLADIHYVRQKEAKGLGHAIYCARTFVGNEPFAVLLGDDVFYSKVPCLQQMKNVFDEYKATILGVQQVAADDVSKYGIIDGTQVEKNIYRVNNMIEKPNKEDAPSNIAILGRYIITPTIFDILSDTKPGRGGEIQLTDALEILRSKEAVYAYALEGARYDIGSKLGFLKANIEYAMRRPDLRDDFKKYLQEFLAAEEQK